MDVGAVRLHVLKIHRCYVCRDSGVAVTLVDLIISGSSRPIGTMRNPS